MSMEVKNTTFPSSLEHIKHIYDDNIDVFVELDDEHIYIIVAITYRNIRSQMDKINDDFLKASYPFIITKKLIMKISKRAI